MKPILHTDDIVQRYLPDARKLAMSAAAHARDIWDKDGVVAQAIEGFFVAARRVVPLNGKSPAKYMMICTSGAVRDAIRTERNTRKGEDPNQHNAEEFACEKPIALDILVLGEKMKRIREAAEIISERDRIILYAILIEGMTEKETGEILGISESRVSQCRTKAIRTLQANEHQSCTEFTGTEIPMLTQCIDDYPLSREIILARIALTCWKNLFSDNYTNAVGNKFQYVLYHAIGNRLTSIFPECSSIAKDILFTNLSDERMLKKYSISPDELNKVKVYVVQAVINHLSFQ